MKSRRINFLLHAMTGKIISTGRLNSAFAGGYQDARTYLLQSTPPVDKATRMFFVRS